MGRIKTKLSKRIASDVVQKHRGSFTTDFEKNKKALERYTDVESKKLRNVIAGYVTRLMKKED